MRTSDVMYWCDPNRHGGNQTKADYLVLAPPEERRMDLHPNSFACCESHLTEAIKIVLENHRNVIVRQVNRKPDEYPSSKQAGG